MPTPATPTASTTATPTPGAERDENLRRILGVVGEKFSAQPERATVRFRASGVGGDGVRSDIRIGRHELVVDEPPALAGQDAGPSPVETALAALLSCQVVTYRLWAAKLGIPLDDVSVDVEGAIDLRRFYGIDDSGRAGFGDVRLVVTLSGPAGEERYRELAAAVDEHCPVLDLFRNPTPVTVEHVTA
ncbi:OsmC family protein [Pseudonocardia dioxanivorans]|jgi:uncharacterized OsmC-like protein|uniref:OsmC family protein n=1 Tax=Pseudonocardia dioxanivorans (strain ATCC 55486 / DSM 44775 / JCM 13855 / CB1190) TaxID=675635 RepID=F4CMX2_PSEUX|nr:OsmC family protein [Pseudonocardia dioxanivorans]AEA25071.1 OsmC family protein [Pseudonocardia dioxanivorans CB1190]